MIVSMHSIRDKLSYRMPIRDLILALRAAVQIDNRTLLGQDIQRCLLSNAAARLMLLAEKIDPAPWNPLWGRIRDGWAVIRRKAVATYVETTIYDPAALSNGEPHDKA